MRIIRGKHNIVLFSNGISEKYDAFFSFFATFLNTSAELPRTDLLFLWPDEHDQIAGTGTSESKNCIGRGSELLMGKDKDDFPVATLDENRFQGILGEHYSIEIRLARRKLHIQAFLAIEAEYGPEAEEPICIGLRGKNRIFRPLVAMAARRTFFRPKDIASSADL